MGFDNECILNIQSLPGEYFCPVCRTLIFPNEALQSQCTHLYCKPCLAYVVATTHACPYDGYLVTEADSKPLLESNKSLAETIGKVQVYCLYHRSGCQWQGTLSDCINHCAGCSYGNSPVVCNRCGTQIVHRQVQEHAQTCPGLQPQGQQVENAQAHALPASNQDVTQDSSAAASAVTATSSTAAVTTVPSTSAAGTTLSMSAAPAVATAANVQAQNQALTVAYPQAGMQAPTAEQWYRQQQLQYQQYYQQYPGYDPYQQQYQQYGQYQQYLQTHMQVAPQQVIQGQPLAQPYVQSQSHVQPLPQPHTLPQAQSQAQVTQLHPQQQQVPQPQPQPPPAPSPTSCPSTAPDSAPAYAPTTCSSSSTTSSSSPFTLSVSSNSASSCSATSSAVTATNYTTGHSAHSACWATPLSTTASISTGSAASTVCSSTAASSTTSATITTPAKSATSSTTASGTIIQPAPASISTTTYAATSPSSPAQPQPQLQSQPLPQPQSQPQPQPHQAQNPSVHGVTGHQSYPQSQPLQQIPHGVPQQRPMNPQQPVVPQQTSQNQFHSHQAQQMRPPQTHMPLQTQQYPAMQPHAQAPYPGAASQPLAQHLAHQPGQQMHPTVSAQVLPQQQLLPQQQAPGHFPSAQMLQQGGFPSQQPSHSQHSQHSLRSQVQPYMQPPSQGRAMAPNQPLPPQVQHSSAKPFQSGMNQHSPDHNHSARQHGSINQSQLHSGSQGSLISVASRSGIDANQVSAVGSDMKSAALEKPVDSILDKASQGKRSEAETATGNAGGYETSRSSELAISKPDSDSKSFAEGSTPIDVNENSETEEKDGLIPKNLRGADFQDGTEESNSYKNIEGAKEDNRTEGKQNTKQLIEGVTTDSALDGPNVAQPLLGNTKQMEKLDQSSGSRSQTAGNTASSIQTAHSMPQGQQQHDVEAHEKAFPPSGYYDKGISQFPPLQAGAAGLRGISPAGPVLVHERYPPQNIPHGHPPNLDAAMVSQRPSGPDGMFSQNMPHVLPSQERRFQEPFPHTIPVHGQPTVPGQPRPPGYSENFPYPVQTPAMAESFLPPAAKQPYSSNIPPSNSEEINLFPMRSQSHAPQPNAIAPGAAQIDPFARSVMGGPPPRAFDAASGVLTRGSHFGFEDRAGRSGPVNLMEGPGYYDGRRSESHRPLPGENAPFGQQTVMLPNMMKMNGLSGMGPAGVMHDSAFSHGVSDDRFRPPAGEGFNLLPDEGLRASEHDKFRPMMDSGRTTAIHRDFEEDLKQFPRPSHLDADGSHRFNMYGPGSRPVERGQHFVPDGGPRPFDRASVGSFPPLPLGGRFPPSSAGLEFGPLEISDRQRGPVFHDDLGGKHESFSERLRPFPEFGRPHIDNFPGMRSPGIPDGPGNFLAEPGLFRKEIDAFDGSHNRLRASEHVGHGLANNIRGGEPYGGWNLPSHLRLNDSAGHAPLRGSESIGFGGYGRIPIGDSGLSNSYPVHDSVSLHGDVDSFEHLRKRKHGSMGWCRLCKIDCETVEGLEVHSQTKDHQNMAMEIVLNIKKENAKKHKLTSEETDDKNKSRKASFENRGGRR
ncbi:mucin-5AC-like [Phalaenopsis equestris]|nr:mucin-5AC-like [Phalaenopsis equestris]